MLRFFIHSVIGLSLSVLCWGTVTSAEKPNILYLLSDDLGWGDVGYHGQKIIKTPNIDALARSGMRFSQHYSGSTVCGPSRACLMTGQHTGHNWVRANGPFELRDSPLDMTAADYLKQAGYHTAMIGKAGTGCRCSSGNPGRNGFDYFFGFLTHTEAHRYFPVSMVRNEEVIQYEGNEGKNGDTFSHDVLLEEVLSYIERESETDQPFFLHYAMTLPHAGLYAPDEFKAPYKPLFPNETPTPANAHYRQCMDPKATFAGMVSRMDWEIGQIVAKLEELGIAENTIVFFASDNGPHSAGGHKATHFDSNGVLRGEKRDLYEGGIRVPHIVSWKGVVEENSVSEHISAFWDFLPTVCELAGIEAPNEIDGISYLPSILGHPDDQVEHDYLYWEFYEKGGKRAVRFGDWKAVQLKMSKGGAPIELYNLKHDLSEESNVAATHPGIVEQARMLFDEAHLPSDLISWDKK